MAIKRTQKRIISNKTNKNVYRLIIALALALRIQPKDLVKNLGNERVKTFVIELQDELRRDKRSRLTRTLNKLGVKIK